MLMRDDDTIVKLLGISKELCELSTVESRIYNDFSEYKWIIHIYPPYNKYDSPYFLLYDNLTVGDATFERSTKCARISMISPEYVRCSDSSKKEWILNNDEKRHLCELMSNDWIWYDLLISSYEDELKFCYGKNINMHHIKRPDYMQLPEE